MITSLMKECRSTKGEQKAKGEETWLDQAGLRSCPWVSYQEVVGGYGCRAIWVPASGLMDVLFPTWAVSDCFNPRATSNIGSMGEASKPRLQLWQKLGELMCKRGVPRGPPESSCSQDQPVLGQKRLPIV